MYTLQKAIDCAIRDAHKKQKQGKFFKADDDSNASQDFTNGDPETIYSLALQYSQFVEDEDVIVAHDKIVDELIKEFPDYA